jgi:hypothetical protein
LPSTIHESGDGVRHTVVNDPGFARRNNLGHLVATRAPDQDLPDFRRSFRAATSGDEEAQQMLDRDARVAAAAFYWVTRLNPNSAEAFYGLRTARHLSDAFRFKRYMEDDRKTIESADVKQIDSLLTRVGGKTLKENRDEYYARLQRVRTNGEWEEWLTFFLEGVTDVARSATETTRQIVTLVEADRQRILSLGRAAGSPAPAPAPGRPLRPATVRPSGRPAEHRSLGRARLPPVRRPDPGP